MMPVNEFVFIGVLSGLVSTFALDIGFSSKFCLRSAVFAAKALPSQFGVLLFSVCCPGFIITAAIAYTRHWDRDQTLWLWPCVFLTGLGLSGMFQRSQNSVTNTRLDDESVIELKRWIRHSETSKTKVIEIMKAAASEPRDI